MLYKNRESIYLNIVVGDTVYSGIETTKYYLDDAKNFRKLLDTCDGPFFEGEDNEIIRNIFIKVYNYFDPLGVPDTDTIIKNVQCQTQLKKALKKAEKRDYIAEEARQISEFIENAQRMSWGQDDSYMETRIFKLVKTEEEFLNLKNIEELTDDKCRIRVGWYEKSFKQQCREKGIRRKYKYLLKYSKNFSHEYDYFKFWYDLKRTGVYYVYISEQ